MAGADKMTIEATRGSIVSTSPAVGGWRLVLVDLHDGRTLRDMPVGTEPVASEALDAQR